MIPLSNHPIYFSNNPILKENGSTDLTAATKLQFPDQDALNFKQLIRGTGEAFSPCYIKPDFSFTHLLLLPLREKGEISWKSIFFPLSFKDLTYCNKIAHVNGKTSLVNELALKICLFVLNLATSPIRIILSPLSSYLYAEKYSRVLKRLWNKQNQDTYVSMPKENRLHFYIPEVGVEESNRAPNRIISIPYHITIDLDQKNNTFKIAEYHVTAKSETDEGCATA